MSRVLLVSIGLMIILGSCTQRLICPAYQSSFIHDKETLRKKFSYFQEDSTPKLFTASTSRNRYLVAVPESYRKKLRSLQTVEMKPVYPQIPDSLKEKEEENLLAERDIVADSTATEGTTGKGLEPTDSAYAITKTKEKYNVEQDNYMWYFRDVLVLPDVRAAMQDKKEQAKEKAKSKKGNFFKNLLNIFKKKDKDSTNVNAPPLQEEETDSITTTAIKAKPVPADKPKEKKSLFRKKEKTPKIKEKKTPEPEKKKKSDAKKEDEDDGF
jgi:hypothetical protein